MYFDSNEAEYVSERFDWSSWYGRESEEIQIEIVELDERSARMLLKIIKRVERMMDRLNLKFCFAKQIFIVKAIVLVWVVNGCKLQWWIWW